MFTDREHPGRFRADLSPCPTRGGGGTWLEAPRWSRCTHLRGPVGAQLAAPSSRVSAGWKPTARMSFGQARRAPSFACSEPTPAFPPLCAHSDEVDHSFRAKPIGCSSPSRSPVPLEADHLFQGMAITLGAKRRWPLLDARYPSDCQWPPCRGPDRRASGPTGAAGGRVSVRVRLDIDRSGDSRRRGSAPSSRPEAPLGPDLAGSDRLRAPRTHDLIPG